MQNISSFFKDSRGRIVIGQWPNWPLWLAICFKLLTLTNSHYLSLLSKWGMAITLIYWSYLEITSGVNNWRKVLGVIVLVLQILAIYNLITG